MSIDGKKATRVLVVLKAVTHLTQTYPGFVGEDGLEDEAAFENL
jgi:hypothetical protein